MLRIYDDKERKIRARISRKKWKINNKKYIKKYNRIHRKEILKWRKQQREKRIKNWIGIIPETTQCQICNKEIYLCSINRLTSIHFDHKKERLAILGRPTEWLCNHIRTPKNETIWKSCNFGMLCGKCNVFLPTKNRKKFIKQVIKYVWK